MLRPGFTTNIMYSYTNYTKCLNAIVQITFCCFLLTSCHTKTNSPKLARESQTLPEIRKSSPNNSSFSEQLTEVRKQTELMDDSTEKMLNRNKKWFVLGIIIFLCLAFQSLINYRQE